MCIFVFITPPKIIEQKKKLFSSFFISIIETTLLDINFSNYIPTRQQPGKR